jgi:ectoine hydroxylase-related dioxygenase (phytanoyl-CoA dioxygenase family)
LRHTLLYGSFYDFFRHGSEKIVPYNSNMVTATNTTYALTEDQIRFFDENGYLVLKNWVQGELLQKLQEAGMNWINEAGDRLADDPLRLDYNFAKREHGEVLFRVNYVHSKGNAASLELLGSPQVLAVAESLCGRNFVPTYESMVFKHAGDGEAIRWHQDAVHPRKHRIFNYDLYLDKSSAEGGALVVIPKSQNEKLDACELERMHGWNPPGSIIVEMEPGDVLLHDVMVVHGSPRTLGNALRRTIYYEFRSAEQILSEGPWGRDWVDNRLRLISMGLEAHQEAFPNDEQFDLRSDQEYRPSPPQNPEELLRILHNGHTPGSSCSAGSVPL